MGVLRWISGRVRGRAATLTLEFDGWFQLRLATDTDPTDEPRGVSGFTFALAGEPDLDRVLRWNDPPPGTIRSHGPPIGVRVRRAAVGRHPLDDAHPLIGARVSLLDDAKLHSRNRIIGRPGCEPLDPLHVEIGGDGFRWRRADPLDPDRPAIDVWDATAEQLARHAPYDFTFNPEDPTIAAELTGVADNPARLRARRERLVEQRVGELDPERVAALTTRLRQLDVGLDDPTDRRITMFHFRAEFDLELCGPAELAADDAVRLPGNRRPDPARPWPLRFCLGGWDPDALCGFTRGTLEIPMRR